MSVKQEASTAMTWATETGARDSGTFAWVVLKSAPTDKPHVHIIPRPIEWDSPRADGDDSSSGSESYETDFDSDSDDDEIGRAHV